jgi:dCMP deaminase
MRISKEEYFLQMADLVSKRGTCNRRQVGCVVTNEHNHVIATGYNGVPRGVAHCQGEHLCPGAKAKSGMSLDLCYATHAEINALIQCKDTMSIHTIYCTTFPCIQCIKAILNTSCERIVAKKTYPHVDDILTWLRKTKRLRCFNFPPPGDCFVVDLHG